MATYKQVRYYMDLAEQLGIPISKQVTDEFAELPVTEASKKLTELEQKRYGETTTDTSKTEEPE